jgi:hypothetical protein
MGMKSMANTLVAMRMETSHSLTRMEMFILEAINTESMRERANWFTQMDKPMMVTSRKDIRMDLALHTIQVEIKLKSLMLKITCREWAYTHMQTGIGLKEYMRMIRLMVWEVSTTLMGHAMKETLRQMRRVAKVQCTMLTRVAMRENGKETTEMAREYSMMRKAINMLESLVMT